MLYVDTDNAMGSNAGDVDDGYALAALLKSKLPITGIGTVFGNTEEISAFHNTRFLCDLLNYSGPIVNGARKPKAYSEAGFFISQCKDPQRVIALGPLTNVANALTRSGKDTLPHIQELIVVGGNTETRGFLPPVWPFEFNLTKDRAATLQVFNSKIPLTFVPLNVAQKLKIGKSEIKMIPGDLGQYFSQTSNRWFKRSRLLTFKEKIIIWDLVAAMYAIEPTLFEVQDVKASILPNSHIKFGKGERSVRVIKKFDPTRVWGQFVEILKS